MNLDELHKMHKDYVTYECAIHGGIEGSGNEAKEGHEEFLEWLVDDFPELLKKYRECLAELDLARAKLQLLQSMKTYQGGNKTSEAEFRDQSSGVPLTLEQLKKREEKPVRIKYIDGGSSYWDVLHSVGRGYDSDQCHFKIYSAMRISLYGKTWLAYDKESS